MWCVVRDWQYDSHQNYGPQVLPDLPFSSVFTQYQSKNQKKRLVLGFKYMKWYEARPQANFTSHVVYSAYITALCFLVLNRFTSEVLTLRDEKVSKFWECLPMINHTKDIIYIPNLNVEYINSHYGFKYI